MNEPLATVEQRWAVVGGGMLGLALARRLAGRGQQVTVFETASEIGGLASAWQLGDITWDRHYHVTLLSDERLRRLLADLGLEADMSWVETKTGFFTDGRLHSMSNTLEFLQFPPLRLIDKLRLGLTIFAASRCRNWKRLERILVGDWLRRWSGKRTFHKIWEPLLAAKLGECYRRTAASFIWATIQRMYKARRSGLKKEMFGYVRGGYARVLQRLGEDLESRGVDIRTSCRVTEVRGETDHSATVVTAEGAESFDGVLLTTPSPLIVQTCPQLGALERRRHEAVEYLGIVCASVLLKRPLGGFYVTNITDRGLPFTAVIEMTTLVDPLDFAGRTLIYLPRYAAVDDDAWGWSDAEVRERFLAGLQRMYPSVSENDVEEFRVSRARHVMALPTLNYSEHLPPMATAIPNVWAINSAHIVKGTLNVNEILQLADEAFDREISPVLTHKITRGVVASATARPPVLKRQTHAQDSGELVARP